MARVVFHEKPGCGGNRRQKARLEAAGHIVEARDLLTTPWTGAELRSYFGDTPVADWFNPSAPRVKCGEIAVATLRADAALALMLAEPLLIRRPLVEAGGVRCAGFDREPVLSLLAGQDIADIQGCARGATAPAAACSPAR